MAVMGREGDDDVDHYEVLRLPSGEEGAALSVERIDKAYRTQSRLRHPDKRPDDPNATADFQSLTSSYNRREAAARAKARGLKRRKAVSDLEERERAFAAGRGVDPAELAKREEKRNIADIERVLNDFAARTSHVCGSASTSAHVDKKGGTSGNGPKTDEGNILKVSWEEGIDYYSAAMLDEIFKQSGTVEDIVIMTKKSRSKGSTLVVMASKLATKTALENHSVYNVFLVPLSVSLVEESDVLPAESTQAPEPRRCNVVGTGSIDLEERLLRNLEEVLK
ncbi:hypothetical protein VPH35_086794 [Triticum aestivum]